MADLAWGKWKRLRDGSAECVLLMNRTQHVLTVFKLPSTCWRIGWSDFEHANLRAKTPEGAQREALRLLRSRSEGQAFRADQMLKALQRMEVGRG